MLHAPGPFCDGHLSVQVRGPDAALLQRRLRLTRTCRAAASVRIAEEQAGLGHLLQQSGTQGHFEVLQSRHGQGIFATRDVGKGQVIMRIPQDACILVDYERGLTIPNLPWPRLRRALQQRNDHPWDILQALALLDALAGEGGAFWEAYASEVLPQPETLTLPFCLSPRLLRELQHEEVAAAALAQKERLRNLFPGLAGEMGPEQPSFFEWAFACVRSRAFRLSKQRFAFVPFMDIANHSSSPNAGFRQDEHGADVELIAVNDVRSGEEATIAYTDRGGCTNQLMMQQYGFVPEGGNPADRIPFDLSGPSTSVRTLSLQRLEALLGEQAFMQMLAGRHSYVTAAIKSLPLRDDDGGGTAAQGLHEERQLAAELRRQCQNALEECGTSVEEDQALLAEDAGTDVRWRAVLAYRVERKTLLRTAKALLKLYEKGS